MTIKDDIGEAEKQERLNKLLLYRDQLKDDVIDAYRHVRLWKRKLDKRTAELEKVEGMIRERKLDASLVLDGPEGGERDA